MFIARSVFRVFILAAFAHTVLAQIPGPSRADTAMYRHGFDIPAGVAHGTWDFDEWPGIDHQVVYVHNFMYNSFPDEKIKIDYWHSVFRSGDYLGYLRTPDELRAHGFLDMHAALPNPKDARKEILGVFAHPDDEVLLAGGLLALAAERGLPVRVYLVSNGADGSAGQADEPSPTTGGYNSYGVMPDGKTVVKTDVEGERKLDVIRDYARELGVRVEILPVDFSVEGKRITQLGEAPGLDFSKTFGPGTAARNVLHDALLALIRNEHPAIVLTHGKDGEYGNYLHKTVHDLVIQAVQEAYPTDPPDLYTCFPEYNFQDRITHFLDLSADGGSAYDRKYSSLKKISFLYKQGTDYDKPWDPTDSLMDGAFVKDYGYTPEDGAPPRYEYFQKIRL